MCVRLVRFIEGVFEKPLIFFETFALVLLLVLAVYVHVFNIFNYKLKMKSDLFKSPTISLLLQAQRKTLL